MIDLGGTQIPLASNTTANAQGVTFTGGNYTGFGGVVSLYKNSLSLTSCTVTGNTATVGGGAFILNGTCTLSLTSCVVTGNSATNTTALGGGVFLTNSTSLLTIDHSVISGNIAGASATNDLVVTGGTLAITNGSTVGAIGMGTDGHIEIAGSNRVDSIQVYNGSGTVTVSSDAVIDLTGNTNSTPIAPGGGITFSAGGATVLYSSGTVAGSYMMDNVTLPAGAKLTNTSVVDCGGATIYVSGGRISGTNFGSAWLYASSTSVLNNITVSGGRVIIVSGSVATDITGSGYATLDVNSGCTMSRAIVENHSLNRVFSGGTSIEPIIKSGGALTVASGASALFVTSNTGATVTIVEGGYITYK